MKVVYKSTILDNILREIDGANFRGVGISHVEVTTEEFDTLLKNLKCYGIVNHGIQPKNYFPKEERYVFVESVEVREIKQ